MVGIKKEKIALTLKKYGLYGPVSLWRDRLSGFRSLEADTRMLRDGSSGLPSSAIIEVTDGCNMSCSMCWLKQEARSAKPQLGLRQMCGIVDKFPDSVREITITGGEPLLREDIIEILKHIKSKGISVMLLTNGFFTDKLERIAKEKLASKINISLDGTEALHDSIRQKKNAFRKAVESMAAINKYGNIECRFLTVINGQNLMYLKELISLLKSYGIHSSFMEYERRYDHMIIDRSLATGMISGDDVAHLNLSGNALPAYSLKGLESAIGELEAHATANNFFIRYLPYSFLSDIGMWYAGSIRKNHRVKCGHLQIARVDASGRLIPCFAVRKSMGGLLESSFQDIWSSAAYNDFRFRLLGNNLLPLCNRCYLCLPYSLAARQKKENIYEHR